MDRCDLKATKTLRLVNKCTAYQYSLLCTTRQFSSVTLQAKKIKMPLKSLKIVATVTLSILIIYTLSIANYESSYVEIENQKQSENFHKENREKIENLTVKNKEENLEKKIQVGDKVSGINIADKFFKISSKSEITAIDSQKTLEVDNKQYANDDSQADKIENNQNLQFRINRKEVNNGKEIIKNIFKRRKISSESYQKKDFPETFEENLMENFKISKKKLKINDYLSAESVENNDEIFNENFEDLNFEKSFEKHDKENEKESDKENVETFSNILTAKIQPANGENIFFIETGDSTFDVNLDARKTCAVESAALKNPNLHIFVLFTSRNRLKKLKMTPQVYAILSYPNVHINYLDMEEFAAGSPMEDFIKSGNLSMSNFRLPHTSDVLRLLTLWRYGGTYLDTDMIVMKSLNSIPPNFACPESEDYMNGAILNFNSNERKKLSEIFIADLTSNFDGEKYSQNGPLLVTRVVKSLCNVKLLSHITSTTNCQGFHILKTDECYPIPYDNWADFMTENNTNFVMNKVKNSIVVHFWNKFTKDTIIKLNSEAPYIQMARKFCPKTITTCKSYF